MLEKCKKCGKELPANSTGKVCGYCLQKRKDNIKKIVTVTGSVVGIAAGVVISIVKPSIGKEIITTASKNIGKL